MSDDSRQRVNLLRQREALREQLARIEQAMASEAESSKPEPKASTLEATASATAPEDADALLRRYAAAEPRFDPKDVRRGCLLALTGALALLVAGVAVVYFLFYARR